jgi:hypothetical protein
VQGVGFGRHPFLLLVIRLSSRVPSGAVIVFFSKPSKPCSRVQRCIRGGSSMMDDDVILSELIAELRQNDGNLLRQIIVGFPCECGVS